MNARDKEFHDKIHALEKRNENLAMQSAMLEKKNAELSTRMVIHKIKSNRLCRFKLLKKKHNSFTAYYTFQNQLESKNEKLKVHLKIFLHEFYL